MSSGIAAGYAPWPEEGTNATELFRWSSNLARGPGEQLRKNMITCGARSPQSVEDTPKCSYSGVHPFCPQRLRSGEVEAQCAMTALPRPLEIHDRSRRRRVRHQWVQASVGAHYD